MNSTLLRLLGDSNVSDVEVRNSFKEPVMIKANSQVALTGVNAILAQYNVISNNNQMMMGAGGYSSTGLPYKQVAFNITPGAYSTFGFVKEIELAMNYPVVNTDAVPILRSQLLGVDHKVTNIAGKLLIESRQTTSANALLDNWVVVGSSPADITNNSFVATATLDDFTMLVSDKHIPLVSSKITGTFENCESHEAEMKVVNLLDESDERFGVMSSDGHWRVFNRRTNIDTGVSCIDGSVISLEQYGGVLTLLKDNTVIWTSPQNFVTRDDLDRTNATLVFAVSAQTDGAISYISCTELDGANPPVLNEVPFQAGIQFVDLLGNKQPELSDYFGFSREYSVITYRGNPAILTGFSIMTGIPNWSGILVCLEGIGMLKSYDGARAARSPNNILYCLNAIRSLNEYVQVDIPAPIYLDLKNAKDINISELRIRLLEASGFTPVKFIGNPSFTLVIRE